MRWQRFSIVFILSLSVAGMYGLSAQTACSEPVTKKQAAGAGKEAGQNKGQDAQAQGKREPSLAWGAQLYTHYCTPCHGTNGDGNGFNAPYLLVKPANHTDAKFMSERSDQKLFDTINLGGAEVAKSTLMPPWGAALDDDNKIRALILKLRDLCQCQAKKNW